MPHLDHLSLNTTPDVTLTTKDRSNDFFLIVRNRNQNDDLLGTTFLHAKSLCQAYDIT